MASIKNLKKDINYILGDVIEECYTWELLNPKADRKASEAIINESIDAFDTLIEMVNADGIFEESEMNMLQRYAVGLGFNDDEIVEAIDITINSLEEGLDEDQILAKFM